MHQEIGEYARKAGIDKLLTIGEDAKHYKGENFPDIKSIFNTLNKAKKVQQF